MAGAADAWRDAAAEGGPRQEPDLEPPPVPTTPPAPTDALFIEDDEAPVIEAADTDLRRVARQAALDPDDGIPL